MSLSDAITDLQRAHLRLIEERDVQVARQHHANLADLDDLLFGLEGLTVRATRALGRFHLSPAGGGAGDHAE